MIAIIQFLDTVSKIEMTSLAKESNVSVVIPVHNEGKTLDWCLFSTRRLDVKEIIVVLDRCEDDSEKISRKHAGKDPRIVIYSLHKHRHRINYIPETLNFAVSKSKNDLICIVDADTILGYGYVTSLRPHIKNLVVSVTGKLIYTHKQHFQFFETIGGTGRLFLREVWDEVGGFKDILTWDTFFDLELLKRGYEIRVTTEATMYDLRNYSMKQLAERAIRRGKGRRQTGQSLPFMIGHGSYYLSRSPLGVIELIGNIAGYLTTQRIKPRELMKVYEAKRIKEIIGRII